MTAEDFKAQGNKAFSAGEFESSITFFSQAIDLDPENHVLYSNRSAAYASLKNYSSALDDAQETIRLKGDWAKGYSRLGAAQYGLGKLSDAAEAYKQGLVIDPQNTLIQKGLQDVEMQIEQDSNPMGGLANMFGPDMFGKIASNPKLAPYLAQPDIVEKLQQCQRDPKNMSQFMSDQRMMQIIIGLMGIDGQMASNPDELAKAKDEASESIDRRNAGSSKVHEPEPAVVEMEVEDEDTQNKRKRVQSDTEKAIGNQYYKKREFEEAISHYDAAWESDKTNVAVLTNKAAVLFEMEKFSECIIACELAVETGREIRADFKLIGRAIGRIGSAHLKLNDLDNAIKFFNKSLAEHRTADILTKLRETEALKEARIKAAYLDPALSDAEREKGNELFKLNQYPDAVKCYSEAIKRNPADCRNYSNRAACYTKLMALPEAEKDCDEAIKLDENFIKAYIRKAAVQFGKREHKKCIDTCNLAIQKDVLGKHTNEINVQIQKAYQAQYAGQAGQSSEENRENAMKDPEVQQILGDPVMQTILKQMQDDPAAARDHMKNPLIMQKLQVLINAGVVSTR